LTAAFRRSSPADIARREMRGDDHGGPMRRNRTGRTPASGARARPKSGLAKRSSSARPGSRPVPMRRTAVATKATVRRPVQCVAIQTTESACLEREDRERKREDEPREPELCDVAHDDWKGTEPRAVTRRTSPAQSSRCTPRPAAGAREEARPMGFRGRRRNEKRSRRPRAR